ncbi:MAG TPA: SAM-dependent methyltransferase [Actinomycetes bacterium]
MPRSFADTAPFFAGLERVEPGLVRLADWRPDPWPEQPWVTVHAYGGVARKP